MSTRWMVLLGLLLVRGPAGCTSDSGAGASSPDPGLALAESSESSSGRGANGKEVDAGEEEPCRPGDPLPEAFEPGGGGVDGPWGIIPGGRRVSPRGTLVPLGRAPVGLALSPDGSRAYVTCDGDSAHALQVIDLDTGEVLQTLGGFEAFRGVAATPDGQGIVVAAGRSGTLLSFSYNEQGDLESGPSLDLVGYLGDLALSADGRRAFVASNTASLVFEVDLKTMELQRSFVTGNFPYDLVADPMGSRLYVSNLAGSTLLVIDLESDEPLAEVPTPKAPEGMVLSAGGEQLFVPCADHDSVLLLDTETLQPLAEIDLSHHPEGLLASSPNDVDLSVDGGTLFVVLADLNQVDLVDTASGELLGSLPTGWYPVALRAIPDGRRLVVLSTKGLGGRPNQVEPNGLLQVVTLPKDDEALAEQTRLVRENNSRPSRFYPRQCAQIMPARDGRLPIEHVVLIVRENKTYDMVLGDLEGGNGDPSLVLFGEDITPNIHALARSFVNLDNFHHDAEESIQGHQWTTQADCTDFVEKLRHTQLPLAGYEPASIAASGSIFEHCLKHGVSFRNYGEAFSFVPEMLGRMRDFIDPKFPFYNMEVLDVDKAREVIREWSLRVFPQFIYIALPNDHTYGTKPGKPTPQSMVADNDRATGLLVEWLSRSQYWEKTVVFIIEDDPQSWRGDHVDAHRSICVVISPWVKRGHVSSVHYNVPSVYRTIEMILGLPPMNKNDAGAAPMYDIFLDPVGKPDLTPFEALPLAVEHTLNTLDSPMAAESMAIDWRDGVDGKPGLGKILWRAMKGEVDPPPYAKGIDR